MATGPDLFVVSKYNHRQHAADLLTRPVPYFLLPPGQKVRRQAGRDPPVMYFDLLFEMKYINRRAVTFKYNKGRPIGRPLSVQVMRK